MLQMLHSLHGIVRTRVRSSHRTGIQPLPRAFASIGLPELTAWNRQRHKEWCWFYAGKKCFNWGYNIGTRTACVDLAIYIHLAEAIQAPNQELLGASLSTTSFPRSQGRWSLVWQQQFHELRGGSLHSWKQPCSSAEVWGTKGKQSVRVGWWRFEAGHDTSLHADMVQVGNKQPAYRIFMEDRCTPFAFLVADIGPWPLSFFHRDPNSSFPDSSRRCLRFVSFIVACTHLILSLFMDTFILNAIPSDVGVNQNERVNERASKYSSNILACFRA